MTAQEAYPLEHLLPSDVLQSTIQVFDLGYNILNLALVRALDVARRADGHINRELDAAHLEPALQPPGVSSEVGRCKAELVFSRVRGAERKAAFAIASLRHDAVVVVKDFIDSDEETDARIGLEGAAVIVPLLDFVVTCGKLVAERRPMSLVNGLSVPTTSVSLGRSSKKHFGCAPFM